MSELLSMKDESITYIPNSCIVSLGECIEDAAYSLHEETNTRPQPILSSGLLSDITL